MNPKLPQLFLQIVFAIVVGLASFVTDAYCVDADEDQIDDQLELSIANLFSPVLHKHPNDLQTALGDPRILPDLFDVGVRLVTKWNWSNVMNWPIYETVSNGLNWDADRRVHYNNPNGQTRMDRVFCPDGYEGVGAPPEDCWGRLPSFYVDIPGNENDRQPMHGPAAPDVMPLFYHIYKDASYYYVQYWYYFWSNDIIDQTRKHTWHEGDWEHVAIRFTMTNNNINTIEPDLVNFYQHYYAWTIEEPNCWWGVQNTPELPALGFDLNSNRTHLHVWIARNSHSSYNRFSDVYHVYVNPTGLNVEENYTDEPAYHTQYLGDPYFFYWNELVSMGEPTHFMVENIDNLHNDQANNGATKHWNYHYEPDESYPSFLAFEEYFGYSSWGMNHIWPLFDLVWLPRSETLPPKSPVATKMGAFPVWEDFYNALADNDNNSPRGGHFGAWYERPNLSWVSGGGNFQVISANQSWVGNRELAQSVIITNGATLTITGNAGTTSHITPGNASIRKIFIENGSLIINANITASFENVSLVFTEHLLNDNTTNLRNAIFDCSNEQSNVLVINRSLTNPITNCDFVNCIRGMAIYPLTSDDYMNVTITNCDFQGPQNAVNAIYLHHTGDNTTVSNCTFTAYTKPIFIYDSAPRITDNVLTWNGAVNIPNDVWRVIGVTVSNSYAWLKHNTITGFAMGIGCVEFSCPRIEGNYITNSGFAHLFNSYSTPDMSWEASNYLADPSNDRIISIKSDGYGMPLMYDGFNSISGAIVNDWVPNQIYPPNHSQRVAMRFNFFHFGRPGTLDQNDYRYNYWMAANEWQNNPRQMDPNCGWNNPNNPVYLTAGMLDLRVGERDPAQNPEYGSMRRDILIQRYGDLFSAQNPQNNCYPWPPNGWLNHENDFQQVNYPGNRQPLQIYTDFNAANNLFEQKNYDAALMAYNTLSSVCQQASRYHLQLACLQRMLWCRKLGSFNDIRNEFNAVANAHQEPAVRVFAKHLIAQLDDWEGQYGAAISIYEDMITDDDTERADSIYAVIGAGNTYLTAARHIELNELDDRLDEEYFTRLQRTLYYGSILSLKPEYMSAFEANKDILMADLHRPKSLEQSDYSITSTCNWNGTIVLENDVIVSTGGSLIIAPGTVVLGNDVNIVVNGTLTAEGTEDLPIRFQNIYPSLTEENYTVPGININLAVNSSQNTIFEHCIFDGSREAICINVDLINDIANCEFIKCDTAIHANSTILPSLSITDCSFTNDGANNLLDGTPWFSSIGIDLLYLSPSLITNCIFNGPMRPIIVRNSNIQITNCRIANSEQHEITEETYGIELHNCTGKLSRNTITGYPSGILLYDSDPSMYANKVENCNREGMRLINDSYPDLTYYGTGGKNWYKDNNLSATTDLCQIRIDGSVYPYMMNGHNNIWDVGVNGYAIWSSLPASGTAMLYSNYWGSANPAGSDLFNYYTSNYIYQPVDASSNQPIEGYLASADDDTNLFLQALQIIAEEKFEDAIPLLREVSLNDSIISNRIGSLSLLMDCTIRSDGETNQFLAHVVGLSDTTVFDKIRRRCLNLNAQMLTELGDYQTAMEFYESVINDEETSYEDSICAVIDAGNVYLRMQNEGDIDNSGTVRLGKIESLIPKSAGDQNEKVQYLIGLLRNRTSDAPIDQRNRFVPSEFRVYQNYPNPFNGYTTLRFDLNIDSRVVIQIYDLMGRNVMTVLDKPLNAGKYLTNVNMVSMSSGIYFVRVQTIERSATIKTILIR